jgi:hypothetical protein
LERFILKELFISYDETHIPTVDDERKIGVRKKMQVGRLNFKGSKSSYLRSLFAM